MLIWLDSSLGDAWQCNMMRINVVIWVHFANFDYAVYLCVSGQKPVCGACEMKL